MSFLSLFYFTCAGVFGVLLLRRLQLALPTLIFLLAGPALGIIVTTEVILVTSLILGLNSLSVFLALGVGGIVVLATYSLKKPNLGKRILTYATVRKTIIEHWPLWITLSSIGLVMTYVFWTKVLAPAEFGLMTGGGGLYGDTALHSSYTTSLVSQDVPPTNPLFAGIPLIYPFLVNLFSATLMILGMNMR